MYSQVVKLTFSITLLKCLIRPLKHFNSASSSLSGNCLLLVPLLYNLRGLLVSSCMNCPLRWLFLLFYVEIKCSSSKKLHPAQFSRHIHTRPCLSYWLQIDTIVWERHIRGKYSQFQNNEYVQLLADKMMTQGMLTQLRAIWDSWSAVRRKSSKESFSRHRTFRNAFHIYV